MKDKIVEFIAECKFTAKGYRGLASLDRVKKRGDSAEYKHYAHMLEAVVDELEEIAND